MKIILLANPYSKLKKNGSERRTVGLELLGKGIARTGYDVLDENSNEIGFVTSGTQSPSSGKSIALAIIDRDAFEMGKSNCANT